MSWVSSLLEAFRKSDLSMVQGSSVVQGPSVMQSTSCDSSLNVIKIYIIAKKKILHKIKTRKI